MTRISLIIILLLSSFDSLTAQTSPYKTFRMGIIQPDTAIIEEMLLQFTDSVENDFIQRYKNSIKHMEEMLEFTDYPEDMRESFEETKNIYKEQIRYLKENESEILNFQYYQLISSYSTEIYNMYFNEYEPYSGIYEISNINKLSLSELADSLKLDYLIEYENLHTSIDNNDLKMHMISNLYSKEEGKIINSQKVTATTNSYGDMWTCLDPLSCLLINSIRNSFESNFLNIRKRQLKKD